VDHRGLLDENKWFHFSTTFNIIQEQRRACVCTYFLSNII